MSQEIIDIRDIKGGESIVTDYNSSQKLADYSKKTEVPDLVKPKYSKKILRADIVWEQDWIKISHQQNYFNVLIKTFTVRTGYGDISLTPIISYPRSEIKGGEVFKGFYVKDEEGILSKNSDIEWILIEYDTEQTGTNYDLRSKIGRNIVLDHGTGTGYHARVMAEFLRASYPDLFTQHNVNIIRSDTDPLTLGDVSERYEPKYAELRKADLFVRPYVGGASSENIGSNPNILKVGAHYGNVFARRNITPDENTFLANAIAVAARVDDTTTQAGTSYGFGLEFFEDWTNMNDEFPDANYYAAFAQVNSSEDLKWLTSTDHPNFIINNSYREPAFVVGKKIYVHYSTDNIFECTIKSLDKTPDANKIEINETLPQVIPSGRYAYMYSTFTQQQGGHQEQSPTCSAVAAKFKKIQLLTNVSWQLIREAARMTASNSTYEEEGGKKIWTTHWDMYRGFGKVRPDLAVEYIQQHYLNNVEYRNSIVPTVPRVNSILKLEDLEDDQVINKSMLLKILEDYIKNDVI